MQLRQRRQQSRFWRLAGVPILRLLAKYVYCSSIIGVLGFLTVHFDLTGRKRHRGMRSTTRQGVVLFAMVVSFGVFYHLAGVDWDSRAPLVTRLSENEPVSPAVFRGRVLQAIADTQTGACPSLSLLSLARLPSSMCFIVASVSDYQKSPSKQQTKTEKTDSTAAKHLSLVALVSDGTQEPPSQRPTMDSKDPVNLLSGAHLQSLSEQLREKIINIGVAPNAAAEPTEPLSKESGKNRLVAT